MDYHIKHIKTIAGFDGNIGFIGVLYLAKKRLGTVVDGADGSPILMEIEDEDMEALNAHVKTFRPVIRFNDNETGKFATIRTTTDQFVGELAEKAFSIDKLKRIR